MRAALCSVFLCLVQAAIHADCMPKNGYIVNKSSNIGYKIMFKSQSWPVARERCAEDGGKLAVPKDKEEFLFIQKLVRAMQYPSVTGSEYRLLVWLGASNLEDYRTWKTVDGHNLKDAGFNVWAGGNGVGFSDAVEEPHCAGMDAVNPGLRDYWCHRRQPYVCQQDVAS